MSAVPDETLRILLDVFGISPVRHRCIPYGTGLINTTYLLQDREGSNHWILQRVNTGVFKQPELIAYNNYLAGEHLRQHHPDYPFMSGKRTANGKDLFMDPGLGAWRVFTYFSDTLSYDNVTDPVQAFTAAEQFGRLTRYLDGVYVQAFKEVIPGFHDLAARWEVYTRALADAPARLKQTSRDVAAFLQDQRRIVDEFKTVAADPEIPDRIVHNDTKVNNVLFSRRTGEAVSVVDLDTLMPGKSLFDLGDMIRTFISKAAEDDPYAGHATVDEPVFQSLVEGWFSEMGPILTANEKKLVYWSGEMLMYEQCLRFYTDHLQGDRYYRINRPEQNLDRASNQMYLLQAYMAKKDALQARVNKVLQSAS